ncbi:MAG: UvrB/UvrC motif-containing protein [Verrucomicrobiota bacterium]
MASLIMKCDACDSEIATIFFSQVADGKVQKVNLCKKCADEKGVTDPTGFALADMLEGMGEETSSGGAVLSEELTCPTCGFTQSDFKKTGRFGCADCYQVFDEGLDSLLEAMHKHTQHAGKVPSTFGDGTLDLAEPEPELESLALIAEPEPIQPDLPFEQGTALASSSSVDKLATLKEKLDSVIANEDYEEAARLRDEISHLEADIEGA